MPTNSQLKFNVLRGNDSSNTVVAPNFCNDNMGNKYIIPLPTTKPIKEEYLKRIGERYGRWTIIALSRRQKRCGVEYLCKCDCGTTRVIQISSLINGKTKSCGCIQKSNYDTKSRLYKIWCHMKGRCYCVTDTKYNQYGGRGITVCDEWKDDYNNFLSWSLNNGYTDELTIERIDVNGNYTPDNCKFITMSEQTKNKTVSHFYKCKGVVYSLKELAVALNKDYKSLHREVTNGQLEKYFLQESNYLEYIHQYETKSFNK